MKRERPPETIGVVAITVVGSADEPESGHVTGNAIFQVGALEGMVVLAFPIRGDVVSVALSTKQAYHLAAAMMRCRAAIARAS